MARCKHTARKSTGGHSYSRVKKVQQEELVPEQVEVVEIESDKDEIPKD